MNRLTSQEKQAMQSLWKISKGSVKMILQNIPNPQPPYTTLASTIKNLEKKGYIKSTMLGNAYLYEPIVSKESYAKQSIGNMVKDHFSNSYKELVTHFAKQKKLTPEDLRDIIKIIEKGGNDE